MIVDPDRIDEDPRLGEEDKRAVKDFARFLGEAGPAPAPAQPTPLEQRLGGALGLGWAPYVLGRFFYGLGQAPPIGYERVAFTAWTFPS